MEADIRLHKPYPWTHGAVSGRWDVQSVATHETGHVIGFPHVGFEHSVMYSLGRTGTTEMRNLSKGDAEANNQKYPQ